MSPRQTKTARGSPREKTHRDALVRGAVHFNHGRYFEAHEEWEYRWRALPERDRAQVQAAILVCGVFVLLEKKRVAPAERLAKRAIERFAEAATASQMLGAPCALHLPKAEERLLRILARMALGESDPALLGSEAKGLKAVVHGLS